MKHFFIDAGGDIHISGANADGKPWRVGIRNPFNRFENVKILSYKKKVSQHQEQQSEDNIFIILIA